VTAMYFCILATLEWQERWISAGNFPKKK